MSLRLLLPLTLCLLTWGASGCEPGRWNRDWGRPDATGKRDWNLYHSKRSTETWTIECVFFEGRGRQQTADRLGAALKNVRKLRPDAVRIVHEPERSVVYYGTYKLQQPEGGTAPAFSAALKEDVKFIRGLSVGNTPPFFHALPIPMPIEDTGPPEWDLRNAKGAYTLHVGVTFNTPTLHNYKQAAVEWVRDLRDRGYEAYYYHDPDKPRSDICVGTFGRDALEEVSPGHHTYSQAVLRLQSEAEFRWNLENGRKISKRRPGTRENAMPNQSFLVRIPQTGTPESPE